MDRKHKTTEENGRLQCILCVVSDPVSYLKIKFMYRDCFLKEENQYNSEKGT